MTNKLPTVDIRNHKKHWDTRGRTGTILSNGYRHGQINGIRDYEHRRIMERVLGRKLRKGETVHHKDGDKLNNSIDNLEVIYNKDHARMHALKNGLGKDRFGISPTNKTPQDTINLIKNLRRDGFLLRQIQEYTHLSWPTVSKYVNQ